MHLKPVIPRPVQIWLRRRFVLRAACEAAAAWPIAPSSGNPPNGWAGWPDKRRFALVLTHDVESRRGLMRCSRVARLEKDLGLTSSFNFVPERYHLPTDVRDGLVADGFEIGVHDLRHDGRLFGSRRAFLKRVTRVNEYLRAWGAVGFRAGSMYHNLAWMHDMAIEYDASTFDTDPFEPQPDGLRTIFPVWVPNPSGVGGYVELPYTLPQDMTLFVLLRQSDTRAWKEKLEWIADRGGMALLITHPDYMHWKDERPQVDEYPIELYRDFLDHVQARFRGQYWNALPMEVSRYWRSRVHTMPAAAR